MKTFKLVCRVVLLFAFCIGLLLKCFGPQIEKAFTYQKAASIAAKVEQTISSRADASPTQPMLEFSTKKTVIAEAITKEVAQVPLPDLRQEFRGKIVVNKKSDSVKPKGSKRLSIGMRKWLFDHKWGYFAAQEISNAALPDTLYNAISGLVVQESGVKPDVKNDKSSATGLMQLIHSTADQEVEDLADECNCGIDPKMFNRKNPNENLIMGIHLFKKNWELTNHSLKWTILYHYAGSGAAKDTAEAHGGIDHVPFVNSVLQIMNEQEEEPPTFAIALYQNF